MRHLDTERFATDRLNNAFTPVKATTWHLTRLRNGQGSKLTENECTTIITRSKDNFYRFKAKIENALTDGSLKPTEKITPENLSQLNRYRPLDWTNPEVVKRVETHLAYLFQEGPYPNSL